VKIIARAATDVGKRRAENEDSFLVDDDHHLYAVADGMGGHNAGEVASATAIEALRATFTDPPQIADAVKRANAAVIDKAHTDAGYENMGTTLTALAIDDSRALIGHVGDSRAYLLRDGELTLITEDHKWVQQLVNEGRLSPEEAETHPQRSIVTRALGIDPDITVDMEAVDLSDGDRLLLCSDGLSDMVREDEIATVLRREPDAQRAARSLVEAANHAGGDDNITVIVVNVEGDSTARGAAASAALEGAPFPEEATGHWEESGETHGQAHDAASAVPLVRAHHEEEEERERAARAHERHRRLMRILAVALPVVIIVTGAVGTLGWYARRTFFVGTSHGQVTLYRGVPGGVLGWQPTIEHRYQIKVSDLAPAFRQDIAPGHKFSSRRAAQHYIAQLRSDARLRAETGDLGSTTTAPQGPTVNTNTSTP